MVDSIIDKVITFNHSKWSLSEALNSAKGQSSVGLFIAFFYGVVLILLTFLTGIAFFIKYIEKDSINNMLMFVGIQMPLVLGYLFSQKALDKDVVKTDNSIISQDLTVTDKKETNI